MSLRNLKSIFEDELKQRTEDYTSNQIQGKNDTKFFNTPPRPTINIATNPTDFSTATGNNELPFTPLSQLGQSALDGMSWETLYNSNHSPKDNPSHKGLVPINYPNVSRDNLNIRDEIGGFRTSLINPIAATLSSIGVTGGSVSQFLQDTGKEPYIVSNIGGGGRLINSNFLDRGFPVERMTTDTARIAKFLTSPAGVLFAGKQQILLGQNQKYKNTYKSLSTLISTFGRAGGGPAGLIDRTQPSLSGVADFVSDIVTGKGISANAYPDFNPSDEPGIISDQFSSGFTTVTNIYGTPISSTLFGKGSPIARKTMGLFQYGHIVRDGEFDPRGVTMEEFLMNETAIGKNDAVGFVENAQSFIPPTYGPFRRDGTFTKTPTGPESYGTGLIHLEDTFTDNTDIIGPQTEKEIAYTYPPKGLERPSGDRMTLAAMIQGNTLTDPKGNSLIGAGTRDSITAGVGEENRLNFNVEGRKEGMPFYFKDLRDNTYLFFRAYIEGLTENISPSYASHNYIGRSEPVYTYERAEREISMTLKLFAQTRDELNSIYQKMDRLTSMCYPEYVDDIYGNRMKPPLTKLRYGEYFGKNNKELLGYIKSLSYTVEQSSPYEIGVGSRVPKHVVATIGYQVIHDKVPSLDTKFYGINDG